MSIGIRQLCKRFGAHAAVTGIDLDIATGELVALLGPSGCGKTTLLRLIAGLEQPDAGEIRFAGEDCGPGAGAPARRRLRVPALRAVPPHEKFMLDLGKVKDIAEVSVNGKSLDVLWQVPYELDITSALKTGVNKIEIKVTNQWYQSDHRRWS